MTNRMLPFVVVSALHTLLVGCGSSTEETDSTSSENVQNSPLKINEIVADATDGGNDWFELYAAEGSIDLSSYTVVDDNDDREPQALPNITLAQGEFIVIQAIDEDDVPPDDDYYVTFKLGSSDSVILLDNGEQVAQLEWQNGDAPEGYSYGLFSDGADSAQTLAPTPGSANEEASAVESEGNAPDDIRINESALIRINEIVASDSLGGADWIEFVVTGSESINLSQYTLADESGMINALPDVTLNSGEFYRLYATDAENPTLDSEHVAFNLGANDEVSLYLEDDLVDSLSWKKGQALTGYSYGRYPDGSDATQILSPSPEATNHKATHSSLVISEVMASDANDGPDWFELYNNSEQSIALIDYEIIDSNNDIEPAALPDETLAPNDYIVIYAVDEEINDHYVPFKLGKEDELSLIKNDVTLDYMDWDDSDVAAGFSHGLSYVIDDDKSWKQGFLTPTSGSENVVASAFDPSVVRDIHFTISNENWSSILANPLDEEYHETSVTFNGVTLDSVAIRTKGGSSLRSVANSSSDRYSFKIDVNEYVDGQKLFGLKKFTLQNSFNDPSYMRETIAYNLLTEMGVPSPQHAYVNVYINDELFGFYLMVEAIDGEFLENHFENANGDLYKPDGTGSDLVWINDNIDSYTDINLQTNEETTDQGAFINFVEKMDNGSTDVIDVDSVLRYMSVSVALSNLDSYHGPLAHNYYIYEQDGVFSLLPWDLNESFGSFSMGCSADIRELYIDEPTDGALAEKPLVANVFAVQSNLDTYHDYLWQLVEGPLANDTFEAEVNRIADLIRAHVENDPTSFYGASLFEQNLNSTVNRFYGLTSFMNYRVANIKDQLNGDAPSSNNGQGFCAR